MFFRELKFEAKYFLLELILAIKHPSRKQTYSDMYYHWYKFWDTLIFHPWYQLKRGIKNLFKWFKIIWKNDIFDYYFLVKMMDKQLKDMEIFWEKQAKTEREGDYQHEVGWRCQYRRIYKRIKWTRRLMKMWMDEHYSMIAYEENKTIFPREPSLFEHDEEDTVRDEYGVPILYTCKPMSEECADDHRLRIDKARKMDEKCLKLWTKNLQHIQGWWH